VPRRKLLLAGVTVLIAAGVAVFVLLRGGDDHHAPPVADPLAEALGYAPISAPLVAEFDVQTSSQQGHALRNLGSTFPIARFGVDSARDAIASLGLDPDNDVDPLLGGGPIVVAGDQQSLTALEGSVASLRPDLTTLLRAGAIAAVVARSADDAREVVERGVADRRLRELHPPGAPAHTRFFAIPHNAAVVAVRDADVLLGHDAQRLIDAIALRDRQGGLTRALFERRLGPLAARPAVIRAFADPRLLLRAHAPGVPFVDALRGGAFALTLERDGLRLRVHLPTDPRRLRPTDLPLAAGPQPPSPAPGVAPMDAGVRGLGQTLRVLDASRHSLKIPFLDPIINALDTIDSVKGPLKRFGGIDLDAALLDQLAGTTTATREPHGWAFRAELNDGGPLRSALNKLAAVPDFALSLANVDEDIDKSGDEAFALKRNGTTVLRLAVLGKTLVATTDPATGLRAIANRPLQHPKSTGALTFHVEASAIQDTIIRRLGLPDLARLVLNAIGDLDGSAQSSVNGVDLDAKLHLER
jgi:hypothetical protein